MPPPPQPNGGKVTPNLAMDAEGTRLLNLTVLQRLDPAVEDILITAGHVTLYDFNIDKNQWVSTPMPSPHSIEDLIRSDAVSIFAQSRKDVEGSLFVVKR
jgi:mRNA-decapping enzyme 1B